MKSNFHHIRTYLLTAKKWQPKKKIEKPTGHQKIAFKRESFVTVSWKLANKDSDLEHPGSFTSSHNIYQSQGAWITG